MMGDDGAGALLATILTQKPLDEWDVLNGGAAPENVLYAIREMAPEQVLVVDATDMDLQPGTIRYIPEERIADPFFLTTHSLPLTYLIEALREFVPNVSLLGIQPEVVAFGFPMSDSVKQAVAQIYSKLKNGNMEWESL